MTTTDTGGFNFGQSGINSQRQRHGASPYPRTSLILGEPNALPSPSGCASATPTPTEVPAHRIRWNGIYDLPFGKGQEVWQRAPRRA